MLRRSASRSAASRRTPAIRRGGQSPRSAAEFTDHTGRGADRIQSWPRGIEGRQAGGSSTSVATGRRRLVGGRPGPPTIRGRGAKGIGKNAASSREALDRKSVV